jgi:hypothetical protein
MPRIQTLYALLKSAQKVRDAKKEEKKKKKKKKKKSGQANL